MIAPHGGGIGWGYARVSTDRQYESTLGIRGYVEQTLRYADAFAIDLGSPRDIVILDEQGNEQRISGRATLLVRVFEVVPSFGLRNRGLGVRI